MMQKHRIKSNIGNDQKLTINLENSFDLFEILSLKLTSKDIYTSMCSDYGVVIGRISINNGLGIPNAKVSIFIPLNEEDEDNPVISELYPYKTVTDINENGYRYNLLPERKQHNGHEPTGTFFDQSDILEREEVLEVYEKYYKYTVKTNQAGDFMIWGVPIGDQILHIDVDLSDIGCFSFRPYDFIRKGHGVDDFKSLYEFKSDIDIDSLPQVITFNKSIEVYPFWGNDDLCNVGVTRTDFDLSGRGIKLEPKAYLIGGTFTDSGKKSINKNCEPRRKMGNKCDLVSKPSQIEYIRFTPKFDINYKPILEYGEIKEDVEDDGAFLVPLPMNMNYLYTNEFGENEYTNNPNKGVPTTACYRFRLGLDDSGNERTRKTASYLVPNIRQYTNDEEKSYAFSLNFDDYPDDAVNSLILNVENGKYVPKDYFFSLTYNKIYTVSSFQNTFFSGFEFDKSKYLGIKELVPDEEVDCASDVLTPPVNFATKNYTFRLFLADALVFLEYIATIFSLLIVNTLTRLFLSLGEAFKGWLTRSISKLFFSLARKLQEVTQLKLRLIIYPQCEKCGSEDDDFEIDEPTEIDENSENDCKVGFINIEPDINTNNLNTYSLIQYTDSGNCSDLDNITQQKLIRHPNDYYLIFNKDGYDIETYLGNVSYFYHNDDGDFMFHDGANQFSNTQNLTTNYFNVEIYTNKKITDDEDDGLIYEYEDSGCDLYDKPYNENLIDGYYVLPGTNGSVGVPCFDNFNYIPKDNYNNQDIISSKIGNIVNCSNFALPKKYNRITMSGISEFKDGIYYIVPGSMTNLRLIGILNEYRKRKRIGTLFCGGIVNYAFIDNWLAGSLYFFQFKAKLKEKRKRTKVKYCDHIVYYNENEERFYYRSSLYDPSTNNWGYTYKENYVRLNHPTTIVDLGPRDEFIKEICVDPELDPNCSVSRSIGPTSYQNFGELLGLAINYRMDVSNNAMRLNDFFDNEGFNSIGAKKVLDGDILQLISINCETGIEEFDLENPKYRMFSTTYLDPEDNSDVFYGNNNSSYGPLPITMELADNGEQIRGCINIPNRLGESSQDVPFFLWNKKGTGFGTHDNILWDNQSWDYTRDNVQVQPLQGMNYGYKLSNNDHEYLLLPITYDFNGYVHTLTSGTTIAEFDIISNEDNHEDFDDEYPGFTYLYVKKLTSDGFPKKGILYVRYSHVLGTWDVMDWTNKKLVIKKTRDYYNGRKQILSTPFMFYFGLRPGKTGLDKLIKYFGPKGAFSS